MITQNDDAEMGGTEDERNSDETDQSKASKRSEQDAAGQRSREESVDMLDDVSVDRRVNVAQDGASNFGATSVASTPTIDLPSIDEQVRIILSLLDDFAWMQEGVKGFIVANVWLERVLSRSSENPRNRTYSKDAQDGPIGPVDNSSLWLDMNADQNFEDEQGEAFVCLKPGLFSGVDFEIFPEQAWDLMVKWYGKASGSPIITRYCHDFSTSEGQGNIQFEQQPPILTILKLPDTSQGIQRKYLDERNSRPIRLLASRSEGLQKFLKRAKTLAGIDVKTKVRVWRMTADLRTKHQDGIPTPAQSRSQSPIPGALPTVDAGDKLVIDLKTFADLREGSERELTEIKDETSNPNYNGKSNLAIHGLSSDGVYILEEMIGGPGGGEWVSDAATSGAKANGVPISVTKSGSTAVKDTLKPTAAGSRGASPGPVGMMTRGRQNRSGRTRGTVGLTNLGNTCYMNSALQCVRSVQELTEYFLASKHLGELNPSNPLGHSGEIAKTYGKLLKEMYDEKTSGSLTPRVFKNTVGKHGPSFSGYQQQDSQEFLLFLLDGLQEDLNRIEKKPYIEKPDSTDEMVNDPTALREMADQCWEIYKKRNDSVITDLFAGMYKSTLVCPHCNKVSIIFDPFNNLTLQLPIQNTWSKNILFFPLRANPFEIAVDIDKNASWSALADLISSKLNLDPKNLIFAEIWQHKLYKIFEARHSISEDNVTDSDVIGCFELEDTPSNWPAPKKPKKTFNLYHPQDDDPIPGDDSPMADRMLVPILHRRTKTTRTATKELFGSPALMIVTREEAQNLHAIKKRILSRVETMTTRDFLREDETPSNEDSDTVVLQADDLSDGRVQAESLESEDGLVDISMKDSRDHEPRFHRKLIAPGLKPDALSPLDTHELFQIRCYSTGTDLIPTGLASFTGGDDDKKFKDLVSRAGGTHEGTAVEREPTQSRFQQRLQQVGNTPPESEEDEPLVPTSEGQLGGDESGSDGLPEVEQIMQKPLPSTANTHSRKANRTLKTYGKKDRRRGRWTSTRRQSSENENQPTREQQLLHLGECIVLDWTDEGYEGLFDGSIVMDEEDGPARGRPTWEDMPIHPDPELEENRRMRAQRRRTGFSLGDCLDEFGKAEILSENDAWYCPRCKEHRRASKTLELWKAPDILVVHLKRFSTQGRFNNKLDVMIDFPLDGLDLTSRLATPPDAGKSPLYELFAVDNHYGGLGGGHYTAYAKSFYDGVWYEYNDSFTGRVKDESVVTPAAYLLFYRRKSDTILGGPFFEHLFSTSTAASGSSSRATSPVAGEGKRLGGFSRNGLSSALPEVGVGHPAGGGGLADQAAEIDGEELPPYSSHASMEVDSHVDEGIGLEDDPPYDPDDLYSNANENRGDPWSFGRLDGVEDAHFPRSQTLQNSDAEDDGASVDAAHSDVSTQDRMADFRDDEGTIMDHFGTPPITDRLAYEDTWATGEEDLYEDKPVANIHLSPKDEDDHTKEKA